VTSARIHVVDNKLKSVKIRTHKALSIMNSAARLMKVSTKLYLTLAFLVLADVVTTHVSTVVFGEYFGEVGLIANFLMLTFEGSWQFVMFPIELGIFGIITYIFGRSDNSVHITSTKKLPLTYFPAIALALIIANNLVQLAIFTARPI
jgi:hypothetical protein